MNERTRKSVAMNWLFTNVARASSSRIPISAGSHNVAVSACIEELGTAVTGQSRGLVADVDLKQQHAPETVLLAEKTELDLEASSCADVRLAAHWSSGRNLVTVKQGPVEE